MKEYSLTIVTPEGKMFDDDVTALTAPGFLGSFGVLANHIPMVAQLQTGIVTLTQNNQKDYFITSDGVLEVTESGSVLILADQCMSAKSKEEAKELLQEQLESKK